MAENNDMKNWDKTHQVIAVPIDTIPKGARLIEAYETATEYIIPGNPTDEEHNCDAMGCTSLNHVIFRQRKDSRTASAVAGEIFKSLDGMAFEDYNTGNKLLLFNLGWWYNTLIRAKYRGLRRWIVVGDMQLERLEFRVLLGESRC